MERPPCTACGATTHRRPTNRLCPQYQPRAPLPVASLAFRKKRKDPSSGDRVHTTVRCKLNTYVQNASTTNVLRDQACKMHRVRVEGGLVAKATLIHSWNTQAAIPVSGSKENTWQQFWYSCYKAVSTARQVCNRLTIYAIEYYNILTITLAHTRRSFSSDCCNLPPGVCPLPVGI